MSDSVAARREFVLGQIVGLAALDFIVVGVPQPPFDAVQVRRNEDNTLAVEVAARAEDQPFAPEQVTALARLGFSAGTESWPAATPPADDAAAVALVEQTLVEVFGASDTTPIDVRHGSDREEHEAQKKIAEMRVRIEPVLAKIAGKAVPTDDDGDYMIDLGHVRVFVAPRALPGRPAIIRVFAITNAGLNLTAELGLFLARLNFSLMFGRFSIDTDHQAVWFDETLLGEHVTDEELRFTVEMVATTANEWDQKIAATFGGRIRDPNAEERPPGEAPARKPGEGGYL